MIHSVGLSPRTSMIFNDPFIATTVHEGTLCVNFVHNMPPKLLASQNWVEIAEKARRRPQTNLARIAVRKEAEVRLPTVCKQLYL